MYNIKINIILLLTLFSIQTAICQNQTCSSYTGVYKSFESFKKSSLDDSICTENNNHTFRASSFDRIVLISDEKRVYKAGDIWGYAHNYETFRYLPQKKMMDDYGYVRVDNTSGVWFYTQLSNVSTQYSSWSSLLIYYSKSGDSDIKKLNIENLKEDYTDKEFLDKISSHIDSLENTTREKALGYFQKINDVFNSLN